MHGSLRQAISCHQLLGNDLLIFRYIARDLLLSTAAVCALLLLIIVSGRFVKYLADAATGALDPGILFAVMGYRLPGFVELILPLAFFLAVLLTYGRMYLENEMSVLFACGMSERRLVAYTMLVAALVALITAWMSLVAAPAGLRKAETLLDAQKNRGELDALLPRQFHALSKGRGTMYVESLSDSGEMSDVFLAQNSDDSAQSQLVVVLSDTARQQKGVESQAGYLVLGNGYRIQGVPGQADYQLTEFSEHGIRLSKPRIRQRAPKVDTLVTPALMQSERLEYQAAFHWRISVPVLVLVVSLMAIPLSKTNPRQGRFAKMFPAMLAYIIYLVLLNAARGMLEEGALPSVLGLWPVHLLFLLFALSVMSWPALQRKRNQKTSAAGVV